MNYNIIAIFKTKKEKFYEIYDISSNVRSSLLELKYRRGGRGGTFYVLKPPERSYRRTVAALLISHITLAVQKKLKRPARQTDESRCQYYFHSF